MFGWPESNNRINIDEHERKRKVCANCNNAYIEGDRYCRFCGAPMGNPNFIEENFACIYGPPPVERQHICKECGYQWTTEEMLDEENYCPKCGGSAPVFSGDEICITLKYQGPNGWIHKKMRVSPDRDVMIGRSPECDVAINNMYISRKQFHILMKGSISRGVFIENMGKTNPAFINGMPLDGLVPLKSGDELRAGTVTILVYFSCD